MTIRSAMLSSALHASIAAGLYRWRGGARRARATLAFLLLLSCCVIPGETFAAIPATERQALVNLYTSANGGAWTSNANWCSSTCPLSGVPQFNAAGSECAWFGVTCDAGQTHVVAIALANNTLAGTLPALGALTSLEYFSVETNHLSGSLPALASLGHLQTFYAGNNAFSGSLPSLAGLTSLGDFAVAHNQLSGTIPSLSGLTGLYSFIVIDNLLSGSVPSMTGLANLREFDAGGNQLSGAIGNPSAATRMLRLSLDRNQLSGSIPALPTTLAVARLAYNKLTGTVPVAPALLYTPAAFASSTLCPNPLTATASANDAGWIAATGYSPWWSMPFVTNRCDDMHTDGFD
jgi:hypothetical protein